VVSTVMELGSADAGLVTSLFLGVRGYSFRTSDRHRIDKYVDARHPFATAVDRAATGHFQKSQSQDGGTAGVIISAYSCVTNHSNAAD